MYMHKGPDPKPIEGDKLKLTCALDQDIHLHTCMINTLLSINPVISRYNSIDDTRIFTSYGLVNRETRFTEN